MTVNRYRISSLYRHAGINIFHGLQMQVSFELSGRYICILRLETPQQKTQCYVVRVVNYPI